MKNLIRQAFSLILLIIGPAKLLYSQQDTLSAKNLSEIVVTGQYKPQSVKQSVYQVKVIPGEAIRKMAATNLQGVLQSQLNLRFGYDPGTGGSDLSMMGLPGQYVKILLDGVPIVGRQGFNNEININQIDIQTVERIEIVEGPMSVIYGADALAGVVNIITKKQSREKFGVSAQLQEETVGKEYGSNLGIHNQHINAFLNHKKWYLTGSIGRNLFQGWKDTMQGRELSWHSKRQFAGSGVLGYRSGKLHAYYRFDGLDELITNPANFSIYNDPAIDQEYISQRVMHQLQTSYMINRRIDVNAMASYTHFTRQVYSSLYYPNGDVRAVSTAGFNTMTTINGFTLRASVQYRPFKFLSLQPGIDVNMEDGEGERIKQGVQRMNDFAVFLTSEIKAGKNLNIKPGIRLIENSVYNAPVVPSLHVKYNITPRFDVRAAYARGFRAPSIRELYFDFIDASHNIIGNQNLKAEYSNSYTASIQFNQKINDGVKFNAVLSAFTNDIKDKIDYYFLDPQGDNTTYMNIADFKSRGVNLENTIATKSMTASLGGGYTGRYNALMQNDKSVPEFSWSPEVNARVSYTFKKAGLTTNLFYKFTGKLPAFQAAGTPTEFEVQLVETSAYHWADITVNKKVGKFLVINAGLKNLFDVTSLNNTMNGGVHAGGGATPLAYGRSFFAGLAFSWAKK